MSAVQLASPSESTSSHVPTSKLGSDIAAAPTIAHVAIRSEAWIEERIVLGTRALSSGAKKGFAEVEFVRTVPRFPPFGLPRNQPELF